MRVNAAAATRRGGTAAVEFACCLPLLVLILTGMLQVGRITEVQQVIWNSAREAVRDASLGQDNLQAVAARLQVYLQSAEPVAFGKGHSISMIAPVVALPANTGGWTCWDNTANRELFTMTYTNLSNPTSTDPTTMSQLDLYQLGVQVPYAGVALNTPVPVANTTRLTASVVWASMVDAPFQVAPYLPAE